MSRLGRELTCVYLQTGPGHKTKEKVQNVLNAEFRGFVFSSSLIDKLVSTARREVAPALKISI